MTVLLTATAGDSFAQTPPAPAPVVAEFVADELIVRLTDGASATTLAALPNGKGEILLLLTLQ